MRQGKIVSLHLCPWGFWSQGQVRVFYSGRTIYQSLADLYKKDLNDVNNHDGVIIHLEPDILECKVKWALESITVNKASGSDEIPAELFQILKHDAFKSAALNMPANFENSAVATGVDKVSFHFNPKERECQRMLKLLHNCTHLTHQ